jgi:hypothetical protein
MNKALLVAAAVAFTCCKPKPPEVDPEFAPSAARVKTTIATLAKIKKSIDTIAPLPHDTLALPGGKKESSTLLTVDQLTKLGDCFPDAMICNSLWWRLSKCDELSNLTPEKATAEFDAVNEVKRCAGLRYVAVARKRSFTKPSAEKGSSTYKAGHISVELLVFDLDTAAYLGGFLAEAKNPSSLDNMTASTNVESYLHEGLGRVIYDAMRARIGT